MVHCLGKSITVGTVQNDSAENLKPPVYRLIKILTTALNVYLNFCTVTACIYWQAIIFIMIKLGSKGGYTEWGGALTKQ